MSSSEVEYAESQRDDERSRLAQAEYDLAAQTETIERRKLTCAQAEEALAEGERLQHALEEEFRTLEETLQAGVQQVLEQIRPTETLSSGAERASRDADARARWEAGQAS